MRVCTNIFKIITTASRIGVTQSEYVRRKDERITKNMRFTVKRHGFILSNYA